MKTPKQAREYQKKYHRNKIYFGLVKQGLIKPMFIDESRLLGEKDLIYINKMNKEGLFTKQDLQYVMDKRI